MHFNTKYIFQGDSKTEISKKVNYNFDQILSFAVGPDGHGGSRGPTGIPGPAGKKGSTGPTGIRANNWVSRPFPPDLSNSIEYDNWIDESTSTYEIKSLSATGSWNSTGYSLFFSSLFGSYSGIVGPAGVTDKYAIGLSNTGILGSYGSLNTNLVINDSILSSVTANPNNSKLLVVTDDSIEIPIFSFVKSTNVVSGSPSFYWTNLGTSLNLTFSSSYSFSINSVLGLTVDSTTSRTVLTGNAMNINATSGFDLVHPGDFYFSSNTTVGSGNFFSVSARNVQISSSSMIFKTPVKISSSSSGFAFDTTKIPIYDPNSSLKLSLGFEIETKNNSFYQFQFLDSNSARIFAVMPNGTIGTGQTGKYSQTFFGSTGGLPPGGTAGPYFYHVQKLREIRSSNYSTQSCIQYGTDPTFLGTRFSARTVSVNPVLDLTALQNWDTNNLLVTPGNTGPSVYLYIPTLLEATPPLLLRNQNNRYRIMINDISGSHSSPNNDAKILGIVWDYYYFTSSSSTTPRVIKTYLNFPKTRDTTSGVYTGYGCSYIDLIYSFITSSTNANPIILWKTCTGSSGFVNVTNKYLVGSTTPPIRIKGLGEAFTFGVIGTNELPFLINTQSNYFSSTEVRISGSSSVSFLTL